ncbi:MAG: triple tyrosine motif-containing protein [Bacteroides intestinalis]
MVNYFLADIGDNSSFYPDEQDEQVFSSPVVITNIKVFNQSWTSLSDEERAEISDLSPGFTDEIVLDYKQNNFSFEFSAMEYANPERNQYAYRLDGFDVGWQYTDASKRFAYYNNLMPGTYTFHVKSSNSNGIWDERYKNSKSYHFASTLENLVGLYLIYISIYWYFLLYFPDCSQPYPFT